MGSFTCDHKDFSSMTCIDYAGAFVANGEPDPIEKQMDAFLKEEVDFEIVRTKRIGMTFIPGGVPTIKVQSSPYHIGPIVEEDLPSSKSKGKWYELTLFETNLVS